MRTLYQNFDCLSDCALWIDAIDEAMGWEWDENGDSEVYSELGDWKADLEAELADVIGVD